jgi:hypothetical protein
MSLSCLWLDLLDLGDLEDLLIGAVLPLGVKERLLDDVGGFLVVVLLLSGSVKSTRGCDLLVPVLEECLGYSKVFHGVA